MLTEKNSIICKISCNKLQCALSPIENSAAAVAEASLLIKVLRNKLVQNKNEVEVQRNNPSSPLHSVKSFEELPL